MVIHILSQKLAIVQQNRSPMIDKEMLM